jgi:hypothetical protein
MEPKKPKIIWRDALKSEIDKATQYKITYKLNKEDIMTFVSGLHELQEDFLEESVKMKEREGFPEANELINHIRSL